MKTSPGVVTVKAMLQGPIVSRPREYILYCDESVTKGAHFSNFYGGALVGSDDIETVRASIAAKKAELHLHGEVKWSKITENYKAKYLELVDHLFDLVDRGRVKLRIMFTQNMFEAQRLTSDQLESSYFLLYYQFIKHAFGFMQYPPARRLDKPINLRIYLDTIPENKEKSDRFKAFLCALTSNPQFATAQLRILPENVTDVLSHEHDLLQLLDIVLGSMQFRLNDKHKEIPAGKHRRGKRTVAKEAVYRRVNERIRRLRPNFNIGISTGLDGDVSNRWRHPYRHWLFIPSDHAIVGTSKKKGVATPP